MADEKLAPRVWRGNRYEYLSACPDCGTARYVQSVRRGRPCDPCSRKRRSTGLRKHPLYPVWNMMKQRCGNPRVRGYQNYGGRGITVCPEWVASAAVFIEWAEANGWRPGLAIDRRDNDGPYSPDNCRWVTRVVNARNTRRAVLTEGDASEIKRLLSEGKTARQISLIFGVAQTNIYNIKHGGSWRDVPARETS